MRDGKKTKKQLLAELEQERERSDVLYQVSNKLAGAHDPDEVLDLIVKETGRLIAAHGAFIFLLENDAMVPSAATDSVANMVAETIQANPTFNVSAGTGLVGHVMATKEPLVVEDGGGEYATSAGRRLAQKYGFHGIAAVPLLANDRSIGVLVVLDKRVRLFTDDEVALLSAFADQASLALEKARLLNEAEREKERSDALYQVSNKLAGVHETDEVLDLIVNEAARLVGATGAIIRLLEGGSLVPGAATESTVAYLAATVALNPTRIVEEHTNVLGHVMASKKPMALKDLQEHELVSAAERKNLQDHGFHGGAAVPLLANNRSIGVLALLDKRIRQITEDELSLLTAFADQASLALEKARLLNEAEREKERSEALYQVSNKLAGVHDTTEVLNLIAEEATRLVGSHGAYIRLLEGQSLVASVATASVDNFLADIALLNPGIKVEEGNTPMAHAMATRKPLVVEDTQNHELVGDAARTNLMKHCIHSGVMAPLLANDTSIGVLNVLDTRTRRYTDDEVSLLTAFADQASLALEKARLLNEAETREREAIQLYEVTTQLATSLDMDSVLDLITAKATEMLGSLGSSILRFDQANGSLLLAKTHNVTPVLLERYTGKPGVGVSGVAFQDGRPVWSSNITTDRTLSWTGGDAGRAIAS